MAHAVEFRPAAASDIRRIYLTIAKAAGRERAGHYIDRIEAACTRLSEFPERGTERYHILPGVRIIGFEHIASIAFIVRTDVVEIVRILPKGMNFPIDWMADP